jgi:cytochrome c oxidase assembly factor CtaG
MDRPDPYSWTVHPEATLAVIALALGYAVAVRGRRIERWRITAFGAGCLLLLVTAVTPLEALSYHLLSAHLLQNVILAEWAPALLVLGIPPDLAERIGRVPAVRHLTRPPVALALWLVAYFAWHLPVAYDTALEHPATLLHLEHATYLVAGSLLWWPVLQNAPHRISNAARALYLFLAFVLASPIGLLLALVPEPAYDYYVEGDGLWGLGPHSDQQIAGVTMAVEQAVVFFAAFAVFFFRFLSDEERAGTTAPSK